MGTYRSRWIVFVLYLLAIAGTRAAISPVGPYTRISFADLNNDGKLDAIAGNIDSMKLYYNVGTAQSPDFGNPAYTFTINPSLDEISPTTGDIDVDGDLDILFGTSSGTIGFYRNTGTAQNPSWTMVNTGFSGDSFNNIIISGSAYQIRLIDLDGDGDLDLTVNVQTADIYYYFNMDKESDGWVDGRGNSFVEKATGIPTGSAGGNGARHDWFDLEGDGDFDLISGTDVSKLVMFRNNGSPFVYNNFTGMTPTFNDQVSGTNITPFFEDFTGDGFQDLYYSNGAGNLTLVSAITRNSPNDYDRSDPVMAADALEVANAQGNTITLRWPYVYDDPASAYRSGVKSCSLYRATDPAEFDTGGGTLIFKHYRFPHFADYLAGAANGDKYRVESGNFYFYDAYLQGGNTYYYRVVVEDYAGNTAETTNYEEASYYLAAPTLTTVSVDLTPALSNDRFTLTATVVDQYGMPFVVSSRPGSSDPNVEFVVYETTAPSGYPLLKYVTGGSTEALEVDTFNDVSEGTYSVTYRPLEGCKSFKVKVEVTDWLSADTFVEVSGVSPTVKVDRVGPPLPANLRAADSEITPTTVMVRWNASTDACSSTAKYRIYFRTVDTTEFTLLNETTNLYYQHTGLERDTLYVYYVTAVDAVNNETVVTNPESVAITVTTKWDIQAPSVPSGVLASYDYGNTQVTVSWAQSTDDFSGVQYYEIQRKNGDSAAWVSLVNIAYPSTAYVDPFAYPGHNVYYHVRAVDNANNYSAYSTTATATQQTDTVPPSVPTNLRGNAQGPTSISLSWNPSTDNAGGSGLKSYKLYRGVSPSVLLAEITSVSYTDNNLIPNTNYSYQVSAKDNAGNESAKCTAVTVKTSVDPNKPNPPRNLKSTATTSTTISLSWDVPTANGATISFYRVYIHASNTSPLNEGYALADPTATTYQVTGLEPGTTCYFTVTAFSTTASESDHSNRLAAATRQEVPSTPANLRLVQTGSTTLNVAWDASTPPVGTTISYYTVYKVVPGPFGSQYVAFSPNATGTSYQITGLTPSTTYTFVVKAFAANGTYSAYSAALVVTTTVEDNVAPPTPTNLHGNSTSPTTISIAWNAVTDEAGGSGLAGYEIYRNSVLVTTVTATEYTDTGLITRTDYIYQVLARDNAGNKSGLSAAATIRTLSDDLIPPGVPANLRGAPVDPFTIDLIWDQVTDNVGGSGVAGFEIYRNGAFLAQSIFTTYEDTNLQPLTTYTYQVLAVDNSGNKSAFSNSLPLTTPTNDTTAPPVPVNLTGEAVNPYTLRVTWPAVTDEIGGSGLAGYQIFRGGTQIGPTLLTATTYTDTGLLPYTSYSYQVKAVDNAGNKSALSAPLVLQTPTDDVTPPGVPAHLVPTVVDAYTVDLTWSQVTDDLNGTGMAGYEVWRDGLYHDTTIFNSYEDINLTPSTTYVYAVLAVDNVNNKSALSVPAEVRTPSDDQTPPPTPANVTGDAVDDRSIHLAWDPVEDGKAGSGLAGYEVYRNGTSLTPAPLKDTEFTDTGLAGYTAYIYTIVAVDNAGNKSAPSAPLEVRTKDLTAPPAPANLQGEPAGDRSIHLTWDAVSDEEGGSGLAGYQVFRGGSMVGQSAANEFTDTGLQSYTEYVYTVLAIDNAGNLSAASAPATVRTLDVMPPSAPTGLSGDALDTQTIHLTWTAAADDAGGSGLAGYEVYRDGLSIASCTATEYLDTNLDPFTEYMYAVLAIDQSDNRSAFSNEIRIRTQSSDTTPPPSPVGLKGAPFGATGIRLSWAPTADEEGGSGIHHYDIYRDGLLLGSSPSNAYTDEGLEPLTEYLYAVQAVDGAENKSPVSPEISALTSGLSSDLLGAHMASSDLWMTRISIVNIGLEDGPVYLLAINANGDLVQKVRLGSLPPAACFEKSIDEIFSPETFTQDIWLRIASSSVLKGVMVFGTRDNKTLVTIPLFTSGAPDLIFPYVYTSDVYYTGITLINTGVDEVTLDLIAYTEAGQELGTVLVTIPAYGKYVRLVNQIYSGIDPNRIRMLQVRSDNPLIGFELFGNALVDEEGLAGLPAFSPTTDLFQVAFKTDPVKTGGTVQTMSMPATPTGFQGFGVSSSDIYLSWNPNSEADIDHYELYKNDSIFPTLAGSASETHFTVSGLQADHNYRYSLKAVNGLGEESEATAILTVRTLLPGQYNYPYQLYYLEIPDPSFYFTGLTFSNQGEQSTKVFGQLYDANGAVLSEFNAPLVLSAKQQKTMNLEGFFGSVLPPGAAYMRIGAMEKILGFELFLTADPSQNPYQFDGLIATESGGATRLFFPLIQSGTDWLTYFRVANLTEAANQYSIFSFDAAGEPVGTFSATLPARGFHNLSLAEIFPMPSGEIAWAYLEANDAVIADIFYFSSDLSRMSCYMGLVGQGE